MVHAYASALHSWANLVSRPAAEVPSLESEPGLWRDYVPHAVACGAVLLLYYITRMHDIRPSAAQIPSSPSSSRYTPSPPSSPGQTDSTLVSSPPTPLPSPTTGTEVSSETARRPTPPVMETELSPKVSLPPKIDPSSALSLVATPPASPAVQPMPIAPDSSPPAMFARAFDADHTPAPEINLVIPTVSSDRETHDPLSPKLDMPGGFPMSPVSASPSPVPGSPSEAPVSMDASRSPSPDSELDVVRIVGCTCALLD